MQTRLAGLKTKCQEHQINPSNPILSEHSLTKSILPQSAGARNFFVNKDSQKSNKVDFIITILYIFLLCPVFLFLFSTFIFIYIFIHIYVYIFIFISIFTIIFIFIFIQC